MLSKYFSQIERFKIIGTNFGADNSLGAAKSVYNHILVALSVHKWEHTHTHIHTHKHTHTHTHTHTHKERERVCEVVTPKAIDLRPLIRNS